MFLLVSILNVYIYIHTTIDINIIQTKNLHKIYQYVNNLPSTLYDICEHDIPPTGAAAMDLIEFN